MYTNSMISLPQSTSGSFEIVQIVAALTDVILAWSWLIVLFLALWVAWEVYNFLKHVDYVSGIQWTYFQITVPDDSQQTPKAMETAFEVWGGIHKDPDVIEKLFEGYFLAWYSCELQCTKSRVRYIMVVPTTHAKFFEGVIYGQYPTAQVREVEDYTQEFPYQKLEQAYDLYGTEMIMVKDDIYPIRLYTEYEDQLAEEDKFVDPHQSMVEAYSNINEGEQFWVQILIKPVGADVISAWADRGFKRIKEISSGEKEEKKPGILGKVFGFIGAIPSEIMSVAFTGTLPEKEEEKRKERYFVNPSEDAEIRAILQNVSRAAFKTKIRLIYIAPAGKLNKPNISKAIGVFKQFNSFHLNSVKPDPVIKTNGPNYFLKQTRRRYRKRHILLDFQWRDFWGDNSGDMFTAEELATIYHFPIKYVRTPTIERSPAGIGSPPTNLPYV